MSSGALRTRYPWNDVNRLQLVEVVRDLKSAAKSQSLKWKGVARRVQNESNVDESMFGRLCAKQFDNLYRAYTKYKQDGDQPPRLTNAIIDEFDELFPRITTRGNASEGDKIGASVDTGSESQDAMTEEAVVKKVSKKLSWSTAARLNLLSAVRGSATPEGKIHWTEVVDRLSNVFDIPEDRLCVLCMKQFTDLTFRYKEFKLVGSQPRRLTVEIIQMLEELYEMVPNLNPFPAGAQQAFGNDKEEVSRGRIVTNNPPGASNHELEHGIASRQEVSRVRAVNSPAVSDHEIAHRSASKHDDVPVVGLGRDKEASSRGKQDLSPDSETGEDLDEPTPPRHEVALGKRKERAETSSSETDTSCHDEYDDDQDAGFQRMDRELLMLQTWLKQEVLPVGREMLSTVKARGRRQHIGKRSKIERHDDFDKLICKASQKSARLAVRAQFQQARANILKEVKQTIEKVGMDLLMKTNNAFQNSHGELPDPSQAGGSG